LTIVKGHEWIVPNNGPKVRRRRSRGLGLASTPIWADENDLFKSIALLFASSFLRRQSLIHYQNDTAPKQINMPKTPTKSTAVKRESTQPYPSSPPVSGGSDTQDEVNDQKLKASRKGTKGSAWTGEEQKQLLHFALNRNGRGWGEAVPGKTATQASSIWT